ncbi:hypothetical protein [Mycoplasmopsis cynos]|uniref:hypothetical protein n=1 Tax=Mycoplasmopsis cynos TaxID=171284 RepID=UPI0024C6AE5E|nr:hypothetical protein [Mycoplasmopsis cynos]WAM04158.1 hypothetical protein ONA01_03665 [Mycoplasmopsis cynos]
MVLPGLKPDHNEAGNSWPLGLDLSRTKHIRSLKGLQFNDIEGKNAGTRKLKRLKLYSEGEYFNIDVDDLNDGQFDTIMISEICHKRLKQKYGSQINQLKKLRLLQEININLQNFRKI